MTAADLAAEASSITRGQPRSGAFRPRRRLRPRTVILALVAYVIALISTAFSAENQRLGDRWAGTYVIAA